MTATSQILRGEVRGADMTEDELLQGIAEALTFGGWVWTHIRRSDRITVGNIGLPDIVAMKDGRLLLWELKSERGQLTPDQLAWQLAGETVDQVDVRVVRPIQYDAALEVIILGADPAVALGGIR